MKLPHGLKLSSDTCEAEKTENQSGIEDFMKTMLGSKHNILNKCPSIPNESEQLRHCTIEESQITFIATVEECQSSDSQLETASSSSSQVQDHLEWIWDYLKSGWRSLLELLKWGWNSLTRAWYFLLFSCNFTDHKEFAVSEWNSLRRVWSSYVGNRDPPNVIFYQCLKRCLKTFLQDWKALTGEQNPLISAYNVLRRCCKSLRHDWDSLTWRFRNPCSGFWKSIASCRSPSKLSWNLDGLCLEPLARFSHLVRGGYQSCLHGWRTLALCWGSATGLGGFLARGWGSLTRGLSSLGSCCGSLSRFWSTLTLCCHTLARCSNFLKRV